MFMGYIIAIFILAALVVTVTNSMRRNRLNSQDQIYRDLALSVAKAGFDDGLSCFRRQNDGVYLAAYPADSPTGVAWVTPWPQWPDSAFLPQAVDTDNYAQISVTTKLVAGTSRTAGAILRTLPLNNYSNTPTSVEMKGSRLWGRYVLRRQNTRNWSPGGNTFAAFSDPDAVHDITHISGQSVPGSGNTWSIVSMGYVFSYPNNLTIQAAHEGNSLLSAPLRFYNGQRLLLAKARVYGELSRINFNQPTAAIFVSRAAAVTVNVNGIVNGVGYAAIARPATDVTVATITGSPAGFLSNPNYDSTPKAPPSVAYVFPGQTNATLKSIASRLDASKVGGVNVLPTYDPSNSTFTAQVSKNSFYYITTTATLNGLGVGSKVMSGVGLMIIEGNLTIGVGNLSSWSGVVVVLGNVNVAPPAEIAGTLICTGTVTFGGGSNNKATLEYNPDAVNTVQAFLQNFQVLNSSVVSTSF
jgi:hypothetical protein